MKRTLSAMVAGVLWIALIRTLPPPAPESAADVELAKSMAAMHTDMGKVRYSGSPDADFAGAMIAHHHGAIEMAKVELQFGQDLRLRRLAQEIIVTQQSEIEVLRGALEKRDAPSLNSKRSDWCTQ